MKIDFLLLILFEMFSELRTALEIINLSEKKLAVADFLVLHGFYEDAYYLGGYAFELRLKAKICTTLAIPDFFDFENSKNRKLPIAKTRRIDKDNLYKPFKIHDFEQLLIFSGLFTEFSKKIFTDLEFGTDWSVISKWDESYRYSTETNKADVVSFLQSIKNMLLWLQQYQ